MINQSLGKMMLVMVVTLPFVQIFSNGESYYLSSSILVILLIIIFFAGNMNGKRETIRLKKNTPYLLIFLFALWFDYSNWIRDVNMDYALIILITQSLLGFLTFGFRSSEDFLNNTVNNPSCKQLLAVPPNS